MNLQDKKLIKNERGTPSNFINAISEIFPIELDVCCAEWNRKAERGLYYVSDEDNGLTQDWESRNWCNPPFSEIPQWVEKALCEADRGRQTLMLLPARIGSPWFYEIVFPISKLASDEWVGPWTSANFDCILVGFNMQEGLLSEIARAWHQEALRMRGRQ
jgi:phage N-6-adenine-methyltransferase